MNQPRSRNTELLLQWYGWIHTDLTSVCVPYHTVIYQLTASDKTSGTGVYCMCRQSSIEIIHNIFVVAQEAHSKAEDVLTGGINCVKMRRKFGVEKLWGLSQ